MGGASRVPKVHHQPRGVRSPPFNIKKHVAIAIAGLYKDHILDITYTNTPEVAEHFVKQEMLGVQNLGFDLEHKPTYIVGEKVNVSLIQFAPLLQPSSDSLTYHPVLLYSIYHDCGTIPAVLQDILSNPTINKFGIGISGDLKHLNYLELPHSARSTFQELGPKAHAAGIVERSGISLKTLISVLMGDEATTYKTKKITMTNWEKHNLNEKELKYAAMDAFAAIEIYRILTDGPIALPATGSSSTLTAPTSSLT